MRGGDKSEYQQSVGRLVVRRSSCTKSSGFRVSEARNIGRVQRGVLGFRNVRNVSVR